MQAAEEAHLSRVAHWHLGPGLGLGLALGLRENFNVADPGIELGDGVCDFEEVPLGLGSGLGLGRV